MYFLDTGLAAYLCRWSNAQALENCAKVQLILIKTLEYYLYMSRQKVF